MLTRCLVVTGLGLAAAGCTPRLKDDAPANRVVSPEELPATFIDRAGKSVELASYRGRFVVLVVVRGLPASGGAFCGYCLAQANGLTANYPQFQQRKAEVLLVVPGSPEVADAFARQAGERATAAPLPYPLVVDPDAVAVGRLGIRGDLAKPSTFILDADGRVVYAYVGKSPSDRPSVRALLGELDRLGGK